MFYLSYWYLVQTISMFVELPVHQLVVFI